MLTVKLLNAESPTPALLGWHPISNFPKGTRQGRELDGTLPYDFGRRKQLRLPIFCLYILCSLYFALCTSFSILFSLVSVLYFLLSFLICKLISYAPVASRHPLAVREEIHIYIGSFAATFSRLSIVHASMTLPSAYRKRSPEGTLLRGGA